MLLGGILFALYKISSKKGGVVTWHALRVHFRNNGIKSSNLEISIPRFRLNIHLDWSKLYNGYTQTPCLTFLKST